MRCASSSPRQRHDPKRLIEGLDRADAEEDLLEFVRLTWPAIEPSRPFVEGWVLGAMCEHLTAVTEGEINRLLINVPPGFMKSLLVDVFWPAWEWGPCNRPALRYLCFSYSEELTKRDNGRFRNLITSRAYRALWGDRFGPGDQFGRRKVENNGTGWKFASSIGGVGTGERGDRVIIDDPNNVRKAESKSVLESTNLWLTEVMPDRLNDQGQSAIILIQQRTAERDCSGTLLSLGADYTHLSVPMEFDPRRFYVNALGWRDPRSKEGELAWEARFPRDEVEKLKRIKGSFAYAGQYQQSPAPRGGGIIKRGDWQVWPLEGETFDAAGKPIKPLEYPPFDYIVASLDTALTEAEENDWSALTVWGSWRDANDVPKLLLMEAWQARLAFYPLVQKVIKTCRKRHTDRLLIESRANGISVAQEIVRLTSEEEFGVQLVDPRKAGGDKVARAYAVQHLFENGLVHAPERQWSEMVIGECEVFPKGAHDDLVDTVTQALWFLRKSGVAQLGAERTDEGRHRLRPPSDRQNEPIYDV
jgi:predicted phage terminase large subunit-like protein